MAAHIATLGVDATPVPVRGRYISRLLQNAAHAAFLGADLHSGRAVLVGPSLVQSALIAGSNVTAVWWAERRQEHRPAIIAGERPLIPRPSRPDDKPPAPNGNGGLMPVPATIDDATLFALIQMAGTDRVLAAAVAVESTTAAVNDNAVWLPPTA